MRNRAAWTAAALLALTALAAAPRTAAAQEPDDLARVVDRLATHWLRGDAGGLVALGAPDGLELDVHGHAVGPVTGRRAAAALRHLFQAQRTVAVRHGPPSRVGGTDNRAFAELTWEVRSEGARISERHTVFVGFVRESSGWKVSQIRIFP